MSLTGVARNELEVGRLSAVSLGGAGRAVAASHQAAPRARLLTIAIPTFRRAAKLDRQLAWLDRNIPASLAPAIELIVCDNASPDDTRAVCERWRQHFGARGVLVRMHCNESNVGAIGNIARCIQMSGGLYTWVIGDDDEIDDGTVGWITDRLRSTGKPDGSGLASIVMNFQGVGKTVYPRCFEFTEDQLDDGRVVIGRCLDQAYFGLAFMTAQVYRTDRARAAISLWPDGVRNYDFQVFVTATAALGGPVFLAHQPRIKYVTGDNVYERDKGVGLRLYGQSVEVFAQLRRIGYPKHLCRQVARKHLWQLKMRFAKGALANSPLLTLGVLGTVTANLARLYAPWHLPAL